MIYIASTLRPRCVAVTKDSDPGDLELHSFGIIWPDCFGSHDLWGLEFYREFLEASNRVWDLRAKREEGRGA